MHVETVMCSSNSYFKLFNSMRYIIGMLIMCYLYIPNSLVQANAKLYRSNDYARASTRKFSEFHPDKTDHQKYLWKNLERVDRLRIVNISRSELLLIKLPLLLFSATLLSWKICNLFEKHRKSLESTCN